MSRRAKLSLCLAASAACGGVWDFAPVAGLAGFGIFIILMTRTQDRLCRFLSAAAYFALATETIVQSSTAYNLSVTVGVEVWAGLTLALASCYIVRGTAVAMILNGVIGVMSPWALAGLLFPGSGFVGAALLISYVAALDLLRWDFRNAVLETVTVTVVAGVFNLCYTPTSASGGGFVGVDTRIVIKGGVLGSIQDAAQVITAAQAVHGRVKILPEAVLDDAGVGTLAMVQAAVPAGETWVIGAVDSGDSVYSFTSDGAQKLFSSALPMPVSMWRPFSDKGLKASWFEPVALIGRYKVWSSICFEQVMPFAWAEALLQQPDVVLLQGNGWWAEGNNAAVAIQYYQARAFARLVPHAAIVEARNF